MGERATRLVDALDETLRSVTTLAESLDAGDWSRPTGCPGWTVHDCVAHIAALEAELLGRPLPAVEVPDLPRLDDPFKQHMEIGVVARRAVPPAALLDELREVAGARLRVLRAAAAGDDDAETAGVMGRVAPLQSALVIRILDIWLHEQDVRHATGRPGHEDGRAVDEVLRRVGPGLAGRLDAAGAPPGTTVEVEISGPAARTVVARRRGEEGAGPLLRLRCDMAAFCNRIGGRRDAAGELVGDVAVVEGDADLGARYIAVMGMTP